MTEIKEHPALGPAKLIGHLCMACGASTTGKSKSCPKCGTCRKIVDGSRLVFLDAEGNITAEWDITPIL